MSPEVSLKTGCLATTTNSEAYHGPGPPAFMNVHPTSARHRVVIGDNTLNTRSQNPALLLIDILNELVYTVPCTRRHFRTTNDFETPRHFVTLLEGQCFETSATACSVDRLRSLTISTTRCGTEGRVKHETSIFLMRHDLRERFAPGRL